MGFQMRGGIVVNQVAIVPSVTIDVELMRAGESARGEGHPSTSIPSRCGYRHILLHVTTASATLLVPTTFAPQMETFPVVRQYLILPLVLPLRIMGVGSLSKRVLQ